MNQWLKGLSLITLCCLATPSYVAQATQSPKNIIMIIGDGMGPSYTSAYRYYMDDVNTDSVETTIFDELLVGMSSTYSAGSYDKRTTKTYVTDSASSATALSTGHKTYNKAIAVDVNGKKLKTVMHAAKQQGKNTGLVVTSQINHATPASYVTHNESRNNYYQLAQSYFDHRIKGQFIADLMFGGGLEFFTPHRKNNQRHLINEFKQAGYQYSDNYQQLKQINRLPALALLGEVDIGYAIDNKEKHRLNGMVTKALELLNKENKGFFLLIEGSLIDWCGHANDIACAMHEMDELAKTVQTVKHFIDNNPNTLMVMTADHRTGGLSVGANGQYQWLTQQVAKIKHSTEYSAQVMVEKPQIKTQALWQQLIGIDISKKQLIKLEKARAKAIAASKKDKKEKRQQKLAETLASITAKNTDTGWTSYNHAGGDVQVFAYGKQAQLFNGYQDNTDIAKTLFQLIN